MLYEINICIKKIKKRDQLFSLTQRFACVICSSVISPEGGYLGVDQQHGKSSLTWQLLLYMYRAKTATTERN